MGRKIVHNEHVNDDKIEGYVEMVAPARVSATLGVTHNLGDFNSVRIDVTWADDFEDGEDFDTASERVYRTVEKKVEQFLSEYTDEA